MDAPLVKWKRLCTGDFAIYLDDIEPPVTWKKCRMASSSHLFMVVDLNNTAMTGRNNFDNFFSDEIIHSPEMTW